MNRKENHFMLLGEPVEIRSRDYWVKVVEMLQQNWALVDDRTDDVRVWFIHDCSGVFDHLDFPERELAESALRQNGFEPSRQEPSWRRTPKPPFIMDPHPNGPIYSSGRYWR
ncbi:hypothetical protein [Sphingomonas sp.]|uniref:hypothetical protein n=1 Tax=Sphingomonas sp. TaxID=28214 RepID=UPI0025D27BE1|nr:hypothetical protein [Sphingomonas sp.]